MPPNETQDASLHNLDNATEALKAAAKSVADNFNHLVASANGALRDASWISPLAALYLAEQIKKALKRLAEAVKKILAKVKEFLDHSAPVVALVTTGFRWVTEVTPPISNQAGLTYQSGTPTDRNAAFHGWTGNARRAYDDGLWNQKSATEATADNSDAIGTWLVQVAAENTRFMLEVAKPLVEIASKIAEAVIDLVTILGAAEAIDSAAEAVAGLGEKIYDVVKEAITNVMNSVSSALETEKILNNNNAYPGGTWPQMVTRS